MKKAAYTFLLLFLYVGLCSHEFWLNPKKYIYKRTEEVNIRFFVGENFEGENWRGNNQRIQSLKLYYGGVSDDLTPCMTEQNGDSIAFSMIDEGTNLIAFNSTNAFIELGAAGFNEYLEEDGLINAIEYRKQNNEEDCAGLEFYQRCAKTLIQVGDVRDKTFNITTSLPIDIVPSKNPYLVDNGEKLPVKILFRQKPMANSLIKIWHRQNNKTKMTAVYSDEDGDILVPVMTKGKWMISTVKMERIEYESKAQWQSYWGTLTWGYE